MERLGGAVVTLLLTSVVTLLLVRLAPGDPVNLILGEGPGDIGPSAELLEERRETLREECGLNDNIPIQYVNRFKDIITLDMETSIRSGRPTTQELGNRVPAAFLLALVTLAVEMGIGVLFGTYTAIHTGRFSDRVIRLFYIVLTSLPAFALPLLFLFWFAIQLNWYEISSRMEQKRLWLSAITLGLLGVPRRTCMVQAVMLAELDQLYVSAFIFRRLSRWVVI